MSVGSQLDEALQRLALNSTGGPDSARLVFGQEYLYAWYTAITTGSLVKLTQAGDSTSAQNDLPANQRILSVLGDYLTNKTGLIPAANLSLASSAVSGETAEHWLRNRVAADAGAHPTLYIIRLGINDPGWLKSPFQAAPLDAGPDYPGRRTAQDTADSIDAGLTLYRASNPVSTASIVLCSPTATHDEPNGRYAPYFEELLPLLKGLARKHSCCFVDTYSLMRDPSKGANLWLDDMGGGRGIHQKPIANTQLVSLLIEALIPSLLRGASVASPQVASIPLANGWAPWNAQTHGSPKAIKSGGVVTLGGLIKNGATAPGTVLGTLPVGMRPGKNEFFSCCSQSSYGSISINPAGQIMIDTCPSNAFFSIAGATFYAEG